MNSLSQASAPAADAGDDFLTILECNAEAGHILAKRYTDPAQPPEGYSEGLSHFRPDEEPISSLADLHRVLDALRAMPDVAVIRDRLRRDASLRADGRVPRRRHSRGDEPGAFEDAPHWWIMLDADKTTVPFDANDRRASVERWRTTLPEGLREAECVFQFSAKQHLSPTLRGHAWFWLSEPLTGPPLKAWAMRHGFDATIFEAVHIHYTADPVFEGCADPLAPRDLIHLPGGLALLELSAEERAATSTANASKRTSIRLSELPEPRDTEAAHAARAAIARPLEYLFAEPGKRWNLCGALGGACAKAGLPAEECVAVLDLLRAGDVSDRDAASGLRWALGAYELDDVNRATGLGEIAKIASAEALERNPEGRYAGTTLVADVVDAAITAYAATFAEAEWASETEAPEPPAETLPAEDAKPDEPLTDDELWARLGVVVDLRTPPKPLKYICESLGLAAGKMSMVTGYAGTSKGLVIALLALCVASGELFLGHEVARTRVGLADFETGDLTTQRLHRIANSLGLDLAALMRDGWFRLIKASKVDASWLDTVRELTKREALGALFGDSYSSIVSSTGIAVDENEARFGELGWDFGRISNETGLCVTLTGHEKKRTNGRRGGSNLEMISGTNALARTCQAVISVVRPNDDKPTCLELRCARHPEDGFAPIGLRWIDEPMPTERPTPGWLLKHAKWGLKAELVAVEPKASSGPARAEAEGGLLAAYRTHRQILAFLAASGEPKTITNMVDSDDVTGRRGKIVDAVADLQEAGLVTRSEPNGYTMQGQPIYHFALAPRSPAVAETLLKWRGMRRLPAV